MTDYSEYWDAEPGWLDTATFGLPPKVAWSALQNALNDWRAGRMAPEPWDSPVVRARDAFARIVNVSPVDVTIGSAVSQIISLVAAALPSRARVLVPEMEFSSNIFPWLVRGLEVKVAPAEKLAEAIDSKIDIVAFSLVQSLTGRVAQHEDIISAARRSGAKVLIDATQACGWLPFDASHADVVVAGTYKWLLAPRGSALAYIAPDFSTTMRPLAAGWYAGEVEHESYYGLPMRLASSARRFDIAPAWFSFVAGAPAMELIERIGVARIYRHNTAHANRLRSALGMSESNSAIVTIRRPGAFDLLHAAGIRVAERSGNVRMAFHIYTTGTDVDRALNVLASSAI